MDLLTCVFSDRLRHLPAVLGALLFALPSHGQDRETVDAYLAQLDRLIDRLEQQVALSGRPQKFGEDAHPDGGLSDSTSLPEPPVVIAVVPGPEPAAEDSCDDSVDELQTQYQEIQKNYAVVNRQITAADERLTNIRNRVRENNYECDGRLLSELEEFIRELEWMPLQEGRDKVTYANLCIEQRGREIDKEMETANHMRLERLMKRQNQVRQITGGTTDLWQEYENFLSKQSRLLQEAKEIRQECAV